MSARGTRKHTCVGSRVEIPAYTDAWMRGARIGTVMRVIVGKGDYLQAGDPRGATIFVVKMDHPQIRRPVKVVSDHCRYVKESA